MVSPSGLMNLGGQYWPQKPFQSEPPAKPSSEQGGQTDAMQAAEQQFQQVQSRAMAEDSDTRSHEAAHQSAAGHLGGGIHLEYAAIEVPMPDGSTRTVTYAAAGHVPISLPGIKADGPSNPGQIGEYQSVLSDLKRAESAATAPSEPSGADMAVAQSASAQITVVQALMAQAQINFSPEPNFSGTQKHDRSAHATQNNDSQNNRSGRKKLDVSA